MALVDIVMPQMGESIAEGTLSKWLKKVGDEVKRDEPMFEISTDKVDAEIPASEAGVIAEILVKEGETVSVQTVVARLETEKGAAVAASASAVAEAVSPAPPATSGGPPPKTQGSSPPAVSPSQVPARSRVGSDSWCSATPASDQHRSLSSAPWRLMATSCAPRPTRRASTAAT